MTPAMIGAWFSTCSQPRETTASSAFLGFVTQMRAVRRDASSRMIETTYEVVEPPTDAIVPELPDGAEKVTIDGKVYYKYADALYEPIYVEGILQYKVIEL